jgi:guanylate kinase
VRRRFPDALLIFVLPPSREEQQRRLQVRGDAADKVAARLRKAEQEEPVGKAISDYVVVNDNLDRTVDELVEIISRERARRHG